MLTAPAGTSPLVMVPFSNELEGLPASTLDKPDSFRASEASWSRSVCPEDHIWIRYSSSSFASNRSCCFLNVLCLHPDIKPHLRCSACHIVCHRDCLPALKFACRRTFRKCVRRHDDIVNHHWVEQRNPSGRCNFCNKSFASLLLLFGSGSGSSRVTALTCSWCKLSYHKEECFAVYEGTECHMGLLKNLILPPSWIVMLSRKESFKSSIKHSSAHCGKSVVSDGDVEGNSVVSKIHIGVVNPYYAFCIKPVPSCDIQPLLVFLNPKSGGNQATKLVHKFQWLLNPRQVFEINQCDIKSCIAMFRQIPNLRILVCGGDGTVGWILSVLDEISFSCTLQPSLGVLPLGTGNDLSRSLGWGGGYIDEPISKILKSLETASVIQVDRWIIETRPNVVSSPSMATEIVTSAQNKLPLNVFNNYFSLGVDALIALQFQEARLANPHKFNSRIRNKMYYGQAGTKGVLLRKWKDLSHQISVECDGKDITPILRAARVQSVLFSNIRYFGSGSRPWDDSKGIQRTDDGLIEVIGITSYQLPLMQACGGHGTCIAQCKHILITTNCIIPMQVDGEACRLNPSVIEISHHNQVGLLTKTNGDILKRKRCQHSSSSSCCDSEYDAGDPDNIAESRLVDITVCHVSLDQYERLHCRRDELKETSALIAHLRIVAESDLEKLRRQIGQMVDGLDSNWCFLDSVTTFRCFRIDRGQESLHYVLDICQNGQIFILSDEIEQHLGQNDTLKSASEKLNTEKTHALRLEVNDSTEEAA